MAGCIDRRAHSYLLPCGLGLRPGVSQRPHVLVIGSTGLLGLAVTRELKLQGFRVAEIRSHFQFDVSEATVYTMLREVNIQAVVNLAHNRTWPQPNFTLSCLHHFCKPRNLFVLQPVRQFSDIPQTIQIKVPPVWGPTLLLPNQSLPGSMIAKCARGLPIDMPHENQDFVFSRSVAKALVGILKKQLNGTEMSSQIQIPNMAKTSLYEIIGMMRERGCKVGAASETIRSYGRQHFESVWSFAQDQLHNRPIPYASLVVAVSDAPRIVDLFSRILKVFAEIFSFYPGLSIEFVAVYCPSESAVGKFYETFEVPGQLRRFFHVIEVPPSFVESLMKYHGINYFPEFHMKNIGIRRSHGEYVLSMNADVIPPVGFFEGIVKRAFSPLSYIRSRRLMTDHSQVPNLISFWFAEQRPI
jgi:hypothetical protein